MLEDIPQTWDEVWAMPPGIYSWVQLQPITGWQPDDTPSGALRVQLTIHRSSVSGIGDTKTCVLEYVDGATHLTRYFGEESASISGTTSDNGRWALNATATPPEEYDLPLADGISSYGKSTYWKTQEGICFVNLAAHSESASIINHYTISTLPYGYRPNKSVYFAGHGFSEDGNRITIDMQINQSGNIIIWTQYPLKYCSGFVGFIATS